MPNRLVANDIYIYERIINQPVYEHHLFIDLSYMGIINLKTMNNITISKIV